MQELISQAEYARRRGCSQPAVLYAVRDGRIKLVDGKIDPAQADREWAANSRARPDSKPAGRKGSNPPPPRAKPPAPPSPPPAAGQISVPDYQESRARREAADADKAEMEAAKMRGELVPAAAVRAEFAKALAAIRESLLTLPGRMAPVLAAESDARRVQTLLDTEIRASLGHAVVAK